MIEAWEAKYGHAILDGARRPANGKLCVAAPSINTNVVDEEDAPDLFPAICMLKNRCSSTKRGARHLCVQREQSALILKDMIFQGYAVRFRTYYILGLSFWRSQADNMAKSPRRRSFSHEAEVRC